MNHKKTIAPASIAVAIGIVLWFTSSLMTGKREPWDASGYWVFAYPAALVASACLGYFYPERPWRWALALFQAQFLAMCIRNGELGNLWPLGMGLFVVVALPGVVVARIASHFGGQPGEGSA